MISEFEWLIVPLMMLLLLGLLLWGLRRESVATLMADLEEIRADDPTVDDDHVPSGPSQLDWLSPAILEDRRFLTSLWQENAPDLVVSLWREMDNLRPTTTSFQQLYLPIHEGLAESLHGIENSFFEGALERGIPERSCFVCAYGFLYLPKRRANLVVYTQFHQDRFEHQFFLMDGDGKLSRVLLRADKSSTEELFGEAYGRYREALLLARSAEFNGSFEEICVELEPHGELRSSVFALRALAAAHPIDARRHLSFALEFEPSHLIALIERAKQGGFSARQQFVGRLREQLSAHSDREAQAGFLLAQGLMVAGQHSIARSLCEALAIDWPNHPGVARLRQHLEEHERGAET